MEASEPTPPGAITSPALVELAARAPGPFATVYLTTERSVDNAAHRSEVRWKTKRDELDDAGAPEAALGQIDASGRRIQQRAEPTWEQGADEVAAQVVQLADRVGAMC